MKTYTSFMYATLYYVLGLFQKQTAKSAITVKHKIPHGYTRKFADIKKMSVCLPFISVEDTILELELSRVKILLALGDFISARA